MTISLVSVDLGARTDADAVPSDVIRGDVIRGDEAGVLREQPVWGLDAYTRYNSFIVRKECRIE